MKAKIPITVYLAGAAVSMFVLMAASVSAENIFVADWYDPGAIYEFAPGGSPTSFYSGGLGEPEDMAFNTAGDLFVADSYDGYIDEITPGGTETSFGSVDDPHGLAFNTAGDLYVSSISDGDIYEFTSEGSETTFATGFSGPGGMAFDKAGDLFVSASSGDIYEFKNNGGTLSASATIFASGLSNPNDLAFYGANLFVGDSSVAGGDIMEITPSGGKSIYADVPGPGGLAFDSAGNLFVADSDASGDVTEIAADGAETIVASGLGNTTGIALQGETLPVPEPSTLAFAALGGVALLFRKKA